MIARAVFVPAWMMFALSGPEPEPAVVELSLAEYRALRVPPPDPGRPPGSRVTSRDLVLQPTEGGFHLDGHWTLEAEPAGFVTGILLGPSIELESATVDGRRAPVFATPLGIVLVLWVGRHATLDVRAFVPGSVDEPLTLTTLPAVRGTLSLAGGQWIPRVAPHGVEDDASVSGSGQVWGGAGTLSIQLEGAQTEEPSHELLAIAHTAIGLTVGDTEVRGRARLRWDVRRGVLERLYIETQHLGDDVSVAGGVVERWSREPGRIAIDLTAPQDARVDVELAWTRAVPPGDENSFPLPMLVPGDAWRRDATVQLARDGELEVVPQLPGWDAMPADDLPAWGRGLIDATPTASFRSADPSRGGEVSLLRYVAVPGPPVVVDIADYQIATTTEGRMLGRVRYELRNERASHLEITPPAGMKLLGARVAGETTTPARAEGGGWRLPLRRSLETVGGLVSFPVEVVFLAEGEAWSSREQRTVELPALDAPIAASRTTLFLPPTFRPKSRSGEGTVVDRFSEGEGISYGLVGSSEGAAAADALFQEAVSAYESNDFDRAQARLDELEAIGAQNENTARLQSNLGVVVTDEREPPLADGNVDAVLVRRVKEQAKARAAGEFRRQRDLEAEANRLRDVGEYDAAERKLDEALDLGGKLANLEQDESVEQVTKNERLERQRVEVGRLKQRAVEFPSPAKKRSKAEPADKVPPVDGESEPDVGFDEGKKGGARSFAKAPEPSVAAGPIDAPFEEESTLSDSTTSREPAIHTESTPSPPPSVNTPSQPLSPAPLSPAPLSPRESEQGRDAGEEPPTPPTSGTAMDEHTSVGVVQRESEVVLRQPSRGRRAVNRAGHAPKDDGVTSYDFDDDNVDGEILRPEGFVAPIERMPAPVTTASALAVVIPEVGRAVLYQELLIEAGIAQRLEVDARRDLSSRLSRVGGRSRPTPADGSSRLPGPERPRRR